jgi:hypothetical protein
MPGHKINFKVKDSPLIRNRQEYYEKEFYLPEKYFSNFISLYLFPITFEQEKNI